MLRLDPNHDHQSLWVCAGDEGGLSSEAISLQVRMHTKATWIPLMLHYKWLKHGEDPDFN